VAEATGTVAPRGASVSLAVDTPLLRESKSIRSADHRSPPMPADDILLDAEERMEKAVDVFRHALTGIRTGRANPGLVDSLKVEVYGSPTPIKALASVGAPEPNQIVVRPFDPGTIKDIEKAIQAADLGLNPQSDGRLIRITIPALSTDVRKKMTARIKELAEEARVAIRNVRRDGNKAADTEKDDGTLTEDECDSAQEEVQELTKKYEAKVGDLAKAKEAEVMEQ
jgi:ribosome recycling factor